MTTACNNGNNGNSCLIIRSLLSTRCYRCYRCYTICQYRRHVTASPAGGSVFAVVKLAIGDTTFRRLGESGIGIVGNRALGWFCGGGVALVLAVACRAGCGHGSACHAYVGAYARRSRAQRSAGVRSPRHINGGRERPATCGYARSARRDLRCRRWSASPIFMM